MDQQRRRQEHFLRAPRVADRQGCACLLEAVGARRQPGGRPEHRRVLGAQRDGSADGWNQLECTGVGRVLCAAQ